MLQKPSGRLIGASNACAPIRHRGFNTSCPTSAPFPENYAIDGTTYGPRIICADIPDTKSITISIDKVFDRGYRAFEDPREFALVDDQARARFDRGLSRALLHAAFYTWAARKAATGSDFLYLKRLFTGIAKCPRFTIEPGRTREIFSSEKSPLAIGHAADNCTVVNNI